jgi:branched-chain amino acid transport system ATP-binding protein
VEPQIMSAVFQVDHLSKAFGGLTVSRDISLSMKEGARLALIGPNGAGKTTFVNLVTGQLRPDAGTIRLSGEDVTRVGSVHRVRKGLVRTFQVTRLFADMTPEEHLILTVLQREGRASRILGRFRRDSVVAGEVENLLNALGLFDVARRKVGEIAYGQQRLLEIALALALKPKVLLLDEPAAGVPQSEIPRIEQALERLPSSLAVLMIEHDMDLVFRFAKHVVVLAAGEIIFEGMPSEVAADARVREAYLGNYADARKHA